VQSAIAIHRFEIKFVLKIHLLQKIICIVPALAGTTEGIVGWWPGIRCPHPKRKKAVFVNLTINS